MMAVQAKDEYGRDILPTYANRAERLGGTGTAADEKELVDEFYDDGVTPTGRKVVVKKGEPAPTAGPAPKEPQAAVPEETVKPQEMGRVASQAPEGTGFIKDADGTMKLVPKSVTAQAERLVSDSPGKDMDTLSREYWAEQEKQGKGAWSSTKKALGWVDRNITGNDDSGVPTEQERISAQEAYGNPVDSWTGLSSFSQPEESKNYGKDSSSGIGAAPQLPATPQTPAPVPPGAPNQGAPAQVPGNNPTPTLPASGEGVVRDQNGVVTRINVTKPGDPKNPDAVKVGEVAQGVGNSDGSVGSDGSAAPVAARGSITSNGSTMQLKPSPGRSPQGGGQLSDANGSAAMDAQGNISETDAAGQPQIKRLTNQSGEGYIKDAQGTATLSNGKVNVEHAMGPEKQGSRGMITPGGDEGGIKALKDVKIETPEDQAFYNKQLREYQQVAKESSDKAEQAGWLFKQHQRELQQLFGARKDLVAQMRDAKFQFQTLRSDGGASRQTRYQSAMLNQQIMGLQEVLGKTEEGIVKTSGALEYARNESSFWQNSADAYNTEAPQRAAEDLTMGKARGETDKKDRRDLTAKKGSLDAMYDRATKSVEKIQKDMEDDFKRQKDTTLAEWQVKNPQGTKEQYQEQRNAVDGMTFQDFVSQHPKAQTYQDAQAKVEQIGGQLDQVDSGIVGFELPGAKPSGNPEKDYQLALTRFEKLNGRKPNYNEQKRMQQAVQAHYQRGGV